ncbi:TPA: hypothetical protein RJE00_000232 [Legionella pneumophila]|nr:hypothetical protein [Legionella pneumophila]HDV5842730.1 hypothetical protein [Legionella pneumophila]HDV5849028.1 hypothetical protein [Legionella pneumophila]HEE0246112.1 hypothetical protein [Legionella pneumophila]
MRTKKVIIIGDSHTDAIKKALKKHPFAESNINISAYRFQKIKNDKSIGDISIEHCMEMVSSLREDDMVFSTIGGNQHQSFSLIQHPFPFEMYEPNYAATNMLNDVPIIPYHVIWDVFASGLQGKDGERLQKIRNVAKCPVFHLVPPPPKKDTMHILQNHESDFVKKGLLEKGITPANLRLKIWKLQTRVLSYLCREWSINLLPVPNDCLSDEGFLDKEYYANDATHGNVSYGFQVLQQIIKIASGSDVMKKVVLI